MTSWRGVMFRVTVPLWGNPPVTGGFPSLRTSDAELWCFLWCTPEQTVEQTVEFPVIWDVMTLMWHRCDVERHHVDRYKYIYRQMVNCKCLGTDLTMSMQWVSQERMAWLLFYSTTASHLQGRNGNAVQTTYCLINTKTQWTRDAIITPLLRRNDVATSFWRNNDVIVTSCVRWEAVKWGQGSRHLSNFCVSMRWFSCDASVITLDIYYLSRPCSYSYVSWCRG